ncbi:UNKNOWN [Stylonychia lemnae]|uniref:Uncharacterized protein n=1 Tax=Stylonychia lemnae TaxID=5949 RepID=A0A077ZXK6_STYLE|nr:UNKNOWN [Stylonychia lemnae]|eukprot:CDW74641.1 UNKNOWN [Stylonychia lemnae]
MKTILPISAALLMGSVMTHNDYRLNQFIEMPKVRQAKANDDDMVPNVNSKVYKAPTDSLMYKMLHGQLSNSDLAKLSSNDQSESSEDKKQITKASDDETQKESQKKNDSDSPDMIKVQAFLPTQNDSYRSSRQLQSNGGFDYNSDNQFKKSKIRKNLNRYKEVGNDSRVNFNAMSRKQQHQLQSDRYFPHENHVDLLSFSSENHGPLFHLIPQNLHSGLYQHSSDNEKWMSNYNQKKFIDNANFQSLVQNEPKVFLPQELQAVPSLRFPDLIHMGGWTESATLPYHNPQDDFVYTGPPTPSPKVLRKYPGYRLNE